MNKAKTFLTAILLSQVVLNTASPVLANPYHREQDNRLYYNSAPPSETIENDTNASELAVLGLLGGLFLWSIFLEFRLNRYSNRG